MNLADPLFETLRHAAHSADVSSGARHAALLLHSMSGIDQSWALSALPIDQRTTLEGLLAELSSLGIARDPALVAEAIAEVEPRTASAQAGTGTPSTEEDLDVLRTDQLAYLVQIMRNEPPSLVAQWLRVRAWPWQSTLLAGLAPLQRAAVTSILAASPAGPLPIDLRKVLVATIVARLGMQPQASYASVAPRPTWRQTVVASVRRFLGPRASGSEVGQ